MAMERGRGGSDGEGGSQAEGAATEKAVVATEPEMNKTKLPVVEPKLCRRHLRQGPIWVKDSAKAAAMYAIKAALKEDPASCYIYVARVAGGDSIKAAEDSESRARGEIYVIKRVGKAAKEEEGKAKLVGVVKQTIKVRDSYIKWLLIASPITPLRPLPEDYFEKNPRHRDSMLSMAFLQLSLIDNIDNVLCQFFEKGYAMTELQIDYGH